MYKRYYRQFLSSAPERLHFAGHSHHYWPDVTRDAALDYWRDSARYADAKWAYLWAEVIPRAQRHVARILGLNDPEQIVFAPNTHEFVTRLISCFEGSRPIRILTTDSEFHSFRRQVMRLREAGRADVTWVASAPPEDFIARFIAEASARPYDLVYISHVFFNSGLVVDPLADLVCGIPAESILAIDGYHAFCALPTRLASIGDRAFYLAGGYKYAQAGEGACFLSVPTGCQLRPMNTGWYADFGGLEGGADAAVRYTDDGMRFAGATFDATGIYRFIAVMDLFEREGITVADIHRYVSGLQKRFLAHLDALDHPLLERDRLLVRPGAEHGHFFTFVLPAEDATARLADALRAVDVVVDHRGDRLRFGFGMYLDDGDIDRLFERIRALRR